MECTRCHVIKPLHEFYRLADGRLTQVTVCRKCRRAEDERPRIRERE